MRDSTNAREAGIRKSVLKKRREGEASAIRPKLELVGRSPIPSPPKAKPKQAAKPAQENWPEPRSLHAELRSVPKLKPDEMLPNDLAALAIDIADRMQAPVDFSAVTIVEMMAGLVGRRVQIQPKAQDCRWIVTPNLWGAIIGAPGTMKSQVINEVTAVVHDLEAALRKVNDEGGPQRRLTTSDPTFEKLQQMLSCNPAGIHVQRDELTGWLAGLERPGREQERSFYLETWDGNTPFTVDRIGRGTIHVPHGCVSLFGGMQPNKVRSYLTTTTRNNLLDDGLIQRIQLLVWPDEAEEFYYRDQKPDELCMREFREFGSWITGFDATQPKVLKFTNGAQQVFEDWYVVHMRRIRRPGGLPENIKNHLAKYGSLMPSLALLFSLFDCDLKPVRTEYALQAIEWCDYLEAHARRVYGSVQSHKQTAGQVLARHLQEGWKSNEGRFTLRDVYRGQWAGLSTKEDAVAAVAALEDQGWIRRDTGQRGDGRPSQKYVINPKSRAYHGDADE